MMDGGVCVLGFRPKERPARRKFSGDGPHVLSRDVVRDLLFDLGFANIEVSEPVPGLVLARAVKN